jgi:hypothetical protein
VALGAAQGLTAGGVSSPPGGATASTVVVAAPLVADDPAPRGDELALRVATFVTGRLGPGARLGPQTAELATARAVAGRAGALAYVRTEIVRGDVRTTVDVYPSMANAWDRVRNPLPAPTRHATATAKVDAEVRAFLGPLVLEESTVDRVRHEEGDVMAAACGDVDGDGTNDIVLVSGARVALGHVRGGRFVTDRAAAWDALVPTSPVTMRDPLGQAAIAGRSIAVGTTARGGVRLTPQLALEAPLVGLPASGLDGVVCLMPEASAGAFDGAPVDCAIGRDPRPKMAVPAPRFDAFGAAVITDASGGARPVVAVREPSGRLRLKAGDTVLAPDGSYGAQLAVGDLDQDGVPDVVTSNDLPPPAAAAAGTGGGARGEDAIDIASWSMGAGVGELRGRLHLAAPGGVRAFAVCPAEEHGAPSLVAVVGNEVWVIRGALHAAAQTAVVAPKQAAPVP